MNKRNTSHKIAVIRLRCIGLSLERLPAYKFPIVEFDINQKRVDELNSGKDPTIGGTDDILQSILARESLFLKNGVSVLFYSKNLEVIANANIYILTVSTLAIKQHRPNFASLIKASHEVGKVLKKCDIVIYKSTVYLGAVENTCISEMERPSRLVFNQNFFAGHLPERISPNDKKHIVEKILKITSGSTLEIGEVVSDIYKPVIADGIHLVSAIKMAEAAKVIENSQRNVDVAFVNELAKIFNILDFDTYVILEAIETKWNFLSFKLRLVGGYYIGVDLYHLAQKGEESRLSSGNYYRRMMCK